MGRRGAGRSSGRPLLTRRTTRGTPSGPRAGRRFGQPKTPPWRPRRDGLARPSFPWSRRRRSDGWSRPTSPNHRPSLPKCLPRSINVPTLPYGRGRPRPPPPKTVVARPWRVRTFVGGGLSLRQTDPTHLRSIGQRLERLGRFVVRQTGKIRVCRIAHMLRWRRALKKASAACRSTPSDFEHTGSIPRRCAVVFEVAKTHRRNTGVARCAPCAGELVAASMAYRTRVKTVVAVRQTAAESR